MKFQLHADMDNAAFDEEPLEEIARVLRRIADKIETGNDEGPVRDENGNTIGRFSVDDVPQTRNLGVEDH